MGISGDKELLIRVDANPVMGTGHLLRCLALAQGWQDLGGEVLFIGCIDSPALIQRIRAEGCRYKELDVVFPGPEDLKWMVTHVAPGQWLVVDGYQFTAAYTGPLRRAGARVLVVDDYNHLPEYEADLLLNQNLGSEDLDYRLNRDAMLLRGSSYVLLRREFLMGKSDLKGDVARHLLVTLGGGDHANITGRVIEALSFLKELSFDVKIVVGSANPHLHRLQEMLAKVSFSYELLHDVENMAPLMAWADVAVTAGGSTCWELAYLGVPALIIIVADNQQEIAGQLAAHGGAVNMGWSHLWTEAELGREIARLLVDTARCQQMAEKAMALVDGRGVSRCLKQMEAA